MGIVDLTDGEPTPLSPGPEVRLAEARRAAEVLGVPERVTLDLPNRRLFDTFEARVALASKFRRFRPRLVIGLGGKTPTASPDHYQASLIIEAAVFYAKLTKWDEHFDGLPRVHASPAGWSASSASTRTGRPTAARWSSTSATRWRRSSRRSPATRASSRRRRPTFSSASGRSPCSRAWRPAFAAGEVLASPTPWGTRDLMGLLFGP